MNGEMPVKSRGWNISLNILHPVEGVKCAGFWTRSEEKILSPLYVPTSKFLHIGQRGKMGGKWEHVEKMIEDQSLRCQGMIYHFDIRRETFNAWCLLALLLYFLHRRLRVWRMEGPEWRLTFPHVTPTLGRAPGSQVLDLKLITAWSWPQLATNRGRSWNTHT